MQYKRERSFLQNLCKDYVLELLEEVGWDEIQKKIVRLKYINNYSIKDIRYTLFLTSATYSRYYLSILKKLNSYILFHKDKDYIKFY